MQTDRLVDDGCAQFGHIDDHLQRLGLAAIHQEHRRFSAVLVIGRH
ncbi:hypothetical protein [Cryobacterium sp. Y62]|nr:hypothetical protein [Cryobacterium sp. Y62]